ncbi:four helix bundle protein [soil metagenome]
MESFRELVVWQKAMALVEQVYQVKKAFPREELYSLTNQIRRASVSVPSNIAEGYGRQSTQDYIRFLLIARDSLNEARTQPEIAKRLLYLPSKNFVCLESLALEIERMLTSLVTKLRTHL